MDRWVAGCGFVGLNPYSMKKAIITLIFLATCVSMAGDDDGIDVTQSDKAYFVKLRHAILTDNEKWISKELRCYPFPVILPSGLIRVKNEEALKSQFGKIFTPKLKKVVRNQSPNSLSASLQGVMVGNGEIWFSEIFVTNENKLKLEYRIISISDPPIPMEDK